MAHMDERRLIRVGEAMRRLPFGRTRYYALTRAGRLPPILKLPGTRAAFVDANALDQIIKQMIEEGATKR